MKYPPIKFKPIYKPKIWGADRLKRLLGKEIPAGEAIGESWELADLTDDKSVVADGHFSGMNIRGVLESHGVAMGFTEKECEFPFGLLIKFLDANQVLSVQVHPDSNSARLFDGAKPKYECWYVIDAEPGSVIYRGLKPGIGRKELEIALTEGNLAQMMQVYQAKKGDVHYLPAGTIHALGAGVVVAEIQTPSDTTYRLYDWGRLDSAGLSRELHIEKALASIHYTATPPAENQIDNSRKDDELCRAYPPAADSHNISTDKRYDVLQNTGIQLGVAENIIKCPYFNMFHLSMSQEGTRSFSGGIPWVLIALSGTGTVFNSNDPDNGCEYSPGDTILIPQMTKGYMKISNPSLCLMVSLGTD